MTPVPTLVLLAVHAAPAIIGVSAQSTGREQVVVVRVEPEVGGLSFTQTGSTVELFLEGTAAPMLEAPPASHTIEHLQLDRDAEGVRVRIQLVEGARAVMRRPDPRTVTVSLQSSEPEPAEAVDTAAALPTVEQLFPLLFPSGAPESSEPDQPVDRDEPDQDGLRLGFLTLRPGLQVTYVDANATFLDTPEPSQTTYFQVQPALEALAAVRVGSGLFTARYEPSVRRGSDFEVVNQTTHTAEATLNMPITPVTTFDGRYRFVRGTLEAREVDPGNEYFFGLGRFTRHGAAGGLDIETGSRTALEFSGYFDDVAFDERDRGFYSHQRYGADAGLRYEIGPTLRSLFGYAYDGVPRPDDRPLAESTAHTAFVRLEGDLGPLTRGSARAGYRWQTNPNGIGDGQSWNGVTLDASLRRDLSPASWLSVMAGRSPYPSAFGSDGFYVSTSVEGRVQMPLPLALAFTGGVGYRWNDYRVVVVEIGEPRNDRIFGWSVGLARSLSPWAFLRADYRWDRRRSNVDAFELDTDSLTIQLGITPFAEPSR